MRVRPAPRPARSCATVLCLLALAACSTAESPAAREPLGRNAPAAAPCPQPRAAERAPESYSWRTNPLPATTENIQAGRRLFERDARPIPCARCHGTAGDGAGPDGRTLVPPPRNFTCAETMRGLTDGQLYWRIERGSGAFHRPSRQGAQDVERPARGAPFAAMPAYGSYLSESDVWQLLLYIRTLAKETDR